MPFRVTNTERYNAMIKVDGGGVSGQAGAIRHGLARALVDWTRANSSRCARPVPHARPAHEGT